MRLPFIREMVLQAPKVQSSRVQAAACAPAQPAWPQPQAASAVFFEAWQAGLQYSLPAAAGQVQFS